MQDSPSPRVLKTQIRDPQPLHLHKVTGMSSNTRLPNFPAWNTLTKTLLCTRVGKLQRQLQQGEYDCLKGAVLFEGDFMPVTSEGHTIDIHRHPEMVTMAIACTSPLLPLPDVLLLARPASGPPRAPKGKGQKAPKALELTGLVPLKFVRVSVHSREKQQLCLQFATGCSCYLQLCSIDPNDFHLWAQLIKVIFSPGDLGCGASLERGTATPARASSGEAVQGLPTTSSMLEVARRVVSLYAHPNRPEKPAPESPPPAPPPTPLPSKPASSESWGSHVDSGSSTTPGRDKGTEAAEGKREETSHQLEGFPIICERPASSSPATVGRKRARRRRETCPGRSGGHGFTTPKRPRPRPLQLVLGHQDPQESTGSGL